MVLIKWLRTLKILVCLLLLRWSQLPLDGMPLIHEDQHVFKVAQRFDLYTGYSFRYLYDESQEVARAYKAACTPEFYLVNANLKLFYHGQFDESRPSNGVLVTGRSTDVFPCAGCAGISICHLRTHLLALLRLKKLQCMLPV